MTWKKFMRVFIHTHICVRKRNEGRRLGAEKTCLWLFLRVSHLAVWTEGALCWREDKIKPRPYERKGWGIFKKENSNDLAKMDEA